MMSKAIEPSDDYVPTSNFYFDNKHPAPKNFDDLQIDSDASVTVKGKITAIRHDQNGKSFEITIGKVKIVPSDSKPLGVGEGMAKLSEERKK
jgi:hypothetical protein